MMRQGLLGIATLLVISSLCGLTLRVTLARNGNTGGGIITTSGHTTNIITSSSSSSSLSSNNNNVHVASDASHTPLTATSTERLLRTVTPSASSSSIVDNMKQKRTSNGAPIPSQPMRARVSENQVAMSDLVPNWQGVRNANLFYLAAGRDFSRPVILLHGAKFTSQTWCDLGTVDLLVDAGYWVVAVDMPGFGKSKGSRLAPLEFLSRFVDMLQFPVAPVIIAPSYSGRFLLSMLSHGAHNINGAVAIAPAFADQAVQAGTLTNYKKPLLIIWGEEDAVFPVKMAGSLHAAVPHSQLMVIPSVGHAAYIEQPRVFHDELMEFLSRLTWSSPSSL